MDSIILRSPAKLNLFLKVLNKRPDGYHNIITLFERINLFDEIYLESNQSGKIRILCDHPQVPLGSKNLVHKVVRLIQEEFGIRKGVEIRIKKRIPVAAGLAGGSSNAATVLAGLNRIWGLHLGLPDLVNFARQIGSDVAFFLYNCSWALGTQRGDQIKRLNLPTKLWHILVVPRIKMYSWMVYKGVKRPAKLELTKTQDDVNILVYHLRDNNLLEINRLLVNDLESEIIRLCPSLLNLKKRLKALKTKGVMISGSGPAVFGLTGTKREAQSLETVFSKRFSQVFVVRTL